MSVAECTELDRDRVRRIIERSFLRVRGAHPTEEQIAALMAAEEAARAKPWRKGTDTPSFPPAVDVRPVATAPLRQAQTWLSDDGLREAEAARAWADQHGIDSVVEALQWFMRHSPPALHAPPLENCIEEYLIVRRCEGVSERSLVAYRPTLARFARAFGGRRAATIAPKETAAYLMHWLNPATRRTRWSILATFFNWAKRMGYVVENPISRGMCVPRVPPPERFVLTVAEAREILRRAKGTDTIGYWVLSMFAGLRTQEIRGLQSLPDPWGAFRFGTGIIDLPAALSKTGQRTVPISPVLRQWLRWMQRHHRPLMPVSWWRKTHALRQEVFKSRLQSAARPGLISAGADPRGYNVGRRSYVSYRLALPDVSFADVTHEVGNTEPTMRKHYYRRVSRRHAVQYFALTPERI